MIAEFNEIVVDVKIGISDETIERCCRLIEMWLDGHPHDRLVCIADEQCGVLRHRVHILRGKEEWKEE